MDRVQINPEMYRWARMRAGHEHAAALRKRFPKFEAWEAGEALPTLKQLEGFAKAMHAPIGFFFLPQPPVEQLPIKDFRTVRNAPVSSPSPELLDTIYMCQQRQDWYRDHQRINAADPLDFVGSVTLQHNVSDTAKGIRERLRFDAARRSQLGRWEDALRDLIEGIESIGILVMCSGVVGSNTSRPLRVEEFRGFALSDQLAPLIFINGADSKAGQMFTLMHEVAHIWLGLTALSNQLPVNVQQDTGMGTQDIGKIEAWCNEVAAEVLVPIEALRAEVRTGQQFDAELQRLARVYKVSSLVIIRRLHELGVLSEDRMWAEYRREVERVATLPPRPGGGDFYLTAPVRASKRFTRALVTNTLEGQTLFRDALRMLGMTKVAGIYQLAQQLK